MTRSVSAAALKSIQDESTAEVWLVILDINHSSLSEPIRVVNNTEDIVHGGETYLAVPFRIKLPDETPDQLPRVTLEMDNVERLITATIRNIRKPPTVTLKVILADSPDTVEIGPFEFTVRNVRYDALVVQADLRLEDILSEPFPVHTFTPGTAPGMF